MLVSPTVTPQCIPSPVAGPEDTSAGKRGAAPAFAALLQSVGQQDATTSGSGGQGCDDPPATGGNRDVEGDTDVQAVESVPLLLLQVPVGQTADVPEGGATDTLEGSSDETSAVSGVQSVASPRGKVAPNTGIAPEIAAEAPLPASTAPATGPGAEPSPAIPGLETQSHADGDGGLPTEGGRTVGAPSPRVPSGATSVSPATQSPAAAGSGSKGEAGRPPVTGVGTAQVESHGAARDAGESAADPGQRLAGDGKRSSAAEQTTVVAASLPSKEQAATAVGAGPADKSVAPPAAVGDNLSRTVASTQSSGSAQDPAASSNVQTSPHTGTISDPDSAVGQLLSHAARLSVPKNSRIQLQLRPASLGTLDLSLVLKDGVLTLRILAESRETRDLLQGSLPELRDALSQRGLEVGQMSLSPNNGTEGRSGWPGSAMSSFDPGGQRAPGGQQAAVGSPGNQARQFSAEEPHGPVHGDDAGSRHLVDYRV